MTISMIGIDHDRAPVDIRALFAFTKKKRRRGNGKTERNCHQCMDVSSCLPVTAWKSGQAMKRDQKLITVQMSLRTEKYRR